MARANALCNAIAAGTSDDNIARTAGLIGRADGEVVVNPPDQISDLNELPIPDFTEYFSDIDAHTDFEGYELSSCLPVEASRGCQYHCSFGPLIFSGKIFESNHLGKFSLHWTITLNGIKC
jgi:radical SAM superfamily enzyme YgiQ (UPF0313 family)